MPQLVKRRFGEKKERQQSPMPITRQHLYRSGFLLMLICFLAPLHADAQSLEVLLNALPQGSYSLTDITPLFTLPIGVFSEDAQKDLRTQEENKPLATSLFSSQGEGSNNDFQVSFRNKEMLVVSWQDGSSLVAVQLKRPRGGNLLLLIRSTEKPFPISALSFYDREGRELPTSDYLPPLTALALAPDSLSAQEKAIFATLPLSFRYDPKKKILAVSTTATRFLSIEEEALVEPYLHGQELLLKWKKGTFQNAQLSLQ